MADAANATLTAIATVQAAFTVLTSLQITEYCYPSNCTLTNASSYDFIIVGGGTAGSVLAYRLSTDSNVTVLLIEEGPYAPLEAQMPGMFSVLPKSSYDYDICSVDDGYTAQNLQGSCVSLTAGKMLGGSAALDHLIYVRGNPHDYDNWATILNDESWTYENCLPYFIKIEKLNDSDDSDGMMKIQSEPNSANDFYLAAFAELNHTIVNDTTSFNSSLGFTQPLFTIGGIDRQTSAYAYLSQAKSRSNLCVALSTTATKILIKNGTAVGVQVQTASGDILVLNANKEVIVSAGAIGSPKLLMLSGIGPQSHLDNVSIPVEADLPVGQNFMDHPGVVVVFQMEANQDPATPTNPYKFPVPTTTGYVAFNSSQTYPDYQVINLIFPHDSTALLQLCANVFKYSNDICNRFYAASEGRSILFAVLNLMLPKSSGKIELASSDPAANPLVYTGTYSDPADLDLMTRSLEDFSRVLTTENFVSVNATLVDTNLCSGLSDSEFWKSYALSMSTPMWHFAGTCAMGSVVDSKMRVQGIENLRVVDASVMPTEVSGNIRAAVTMIAERASDFIRTDHNLS